MFLLRRYLAKINLTDHLPSSIMTNISVTHLTWLKADVKAAISNSSSTARSNLAFGQVFYPNCISPILIGFYSYNTLLRTETDPQRSALHRS
jgi:hypothetical protein